MWSATETTSAGSASRRSAHWWKPPWGSSWRGKWWILTFHCSVPRSCNKSTADPWTTWVELCSVTYTWTFKINVQSALRIRGFLSRGFHWSIHYWWLLESADMEPADTEDWPRDLRIPGFWYPRWVPEPIPHGYWGTVVSCLSLMSVTEYSSPCRAVSFALGITWFSSLRLLRSLNHQLTHVVAESKLFLCCPLLVVRPVICWSFISPESRVFSMHISDCSPFISPFHVVS